MTGKIPVTAKMVLESEESQWRLLINGLINELNTTAIIERAPGSRVRIQIVIKTIIPPENLYGKNKCQISSNLEKELSNGLARSYEFFDDFLRKSTWLFVGLINGKETSPILITYYAVINIFIYTQKLKEEEKENFFPSAGLN